MLFDSPRELPTATVVVEPRTLSELVRRGIALWFSERWQWLRPRTIPLAFAFAGLLGMVHAIDYLSHLPAPAQKASITATGSAPAAPAYELMRQRIVVSQ